MEERWWKQPAEVVRFLIVLILCSTGKSGTENFMYNCSGEEALSRGRCMAPLDYRTDV
jgi:hypothetical protein